MITLDGGPLSSQDVLDVVRGGQTVALGEKARAAMAASARVVERLDQADSVAYGVTTGFGALASVAVPAGARRTLQRSLVLSHAAGMGDAVDDEVVLAMMLLRARTLSVGLSGVRPLVVDALLQLLNDRVVPFVPAEGSLGASGDLAPLAHIAAVLVGSGWVKVEGRREAGESFCARHGFTPLLLEPKEGLGLINGTDGMTGLLTLALADMADLMDFADVAAAMSVEAAMGSVTPFGERVLSLRPSPGQQLCGRHLRQLLDQSPVVAFHQPSHHLVQDAYSFRCTPQVHGAARDQLEFAEVVVARERDSVVDNPVVFPDDEALVSAGNFHGQALSYVADILAMVMADVAALSERRIARLLDPATSHGLPAFLVKEPGINSGFMIAQYTAADCVARLRHLATPFSVHSAVTSAGQEDHVSMGWGGALRTRSAISFLRHTLAIELVLGAQALELRKPLSPAPGTGAILNSLRQHVPTMPGDEFVAPLLEQADKWMQEEDTRTLVASVLAPRM